MNADDAQMIAALPSRAFQPRVYGVGAWTDNIHFAYDLVALLGPRVLVELGVDRGESFFAFCQSAAENATGTRCFGVDLWTGDEHVGGYDETTYREVAAHTAQHYSELATLLRMGFDEARNNFANGSVDILHIDGLHTEEAVRHDVETWLSKLREGGILLMHDVCVRNRGFGVWKVWEEQKTRGRAWTFTAGPGLGVWQKPPGSTLPPPLEALLRAGDQSADALARYYREKADDVQRQIASDWQTGAVRHNAIGNQTIVQIFYTRADAAGHSEENSVLARIGHGDLKELALQLPNGAGANPLRIDFVSAFTVVDVESLQVTQADGTVLFAAATAAEFDAVQVAGDCVREPSPKGLQLRITGIDPQLYLPPLASAGETERLTVRLKLRVTAPT